VTGDRPVLLGLLLYALLASTPVLILWAAVRFLPAAATSLLDRRNRRAGTSTGPSLQALVCTLRRLRREVCGVPQATQVRTRALLAAYDHTLIDLCRLVEVDAPLETAEEPDRPFARLLTEAALEDAGIALDPPTRA
jgi:hypothetical protein